MRCRCARDGRETPLQGARAEAQGVRPGLDGDTARQVFQSAEQRAQVGRAPPGRAGFHPGGRSATVARRLATTRARVSGVATTQAPAANQACRDAAPSRSASRTNSAPRRPAASTSSRAGQSCRAGSDTIATRASGQRPGSPNSRAAIRVKGREPSREPCGRCPMTTRVAASARAPSSPGIPSSSEIRFPQADGAVNTPFGRAVANCTELVANGTRPLRRLRRKLGAFQTIHSSGLPEGARSSRLPEGPP